jgi:uncharacterized membrane protein (DUF485 family)
MTRKWIAASVAICVMWVAVLFIAIFAPELEAHSAGGDTTTLPLAGIIAVGCAFVCTLVVASVGFGSRRQDAEVERLERRVHELEVSVSH